MPVKNQLEVYKCEVCGNIVMVLFVGGGELVCCGKPMLLLQENTTDAAQEKHVPVIEQKGDSVTVKVGEVAHPMEDDHYIQWIELQAEGASYIKHLKAGDAPVAEFKVKAAKLSAREYCSKHGLWKA